MTLKTNATAIYNRFNNNYLIVFSGGFLLLALLWFTLIFPIMEANSKIEKHLPDMQEELLALREIGGQIRFMEDSLTDFTPQEKKIKQETMLKQVERLAKDAKVFNSITNITPSKIRKKGKDMKALALEFEQTDMARLTPFLHNIGHKSLLTMHEIELRRSNKSSGGIVARIVLVEGGV